MAFKSIPHNHTGDIIEIEKYALSRGFKTVSAVFDTYVKYPKRLEAYYSLAADSMLFSGTCESIMNELANIPKEVITSE